MQFEVPQFIEIEDKIFGPLTWKQFLYVGGGLSMTAVLFFTMPFVIFLFLGVPIALLALALAFYPINNRPFSHLLEAIYSFFTRQRVYHWQQTKNIVYKDTLTVNTEASPTLADSLLKKKDISSMARRLELEAMQKNNS
jgi:PrgI family protein